MKQGTTVYRITALLEWDDRLRYVTWRGASPAAIRRAIKNEYASSGARISFGNYASVNGYGAH